MFWDPLGNGDVYMCYIDTHFHFKISVYNISFKIYNCVQKQILGFYNQKGYKARCIWGDHFREMGILVYFQYKIKMPEIYPLSLLRPKYRIQGNLQKLCNHTTGRWAFLGGAANTELELRL